MLMAKALESGTGERRRVNNAALRTLLGNTELTTVVPVAANRNIVGPDFAYDSSSRATMSAGGDGMDNAISVLLHAGNRVVLVLDNPELRDPRQCMDRRPLAWPFVRHVLGVSDLNAAQRCAISYRSYLEGTSAYRAIVDQLIARHLDLTVYDPTSVLRDSQRNVCPMTMNGKYLYRYGDHMSDYANRLVAERLLPLVVRRSRRRHCCRDAAARVSFIDCELNRSLGVSTNDVCFDPNVEIAHMDRKRVQCASATNSMHRVNIVPAAVE